VFGSVNAYGIAAVFALSGLPEACSRFQSGDAPKPEAPPFQITMVVVGEDKQGIAESQILLGKKVAATTGKKGTAKLFFRGDEGSTVSLTVKCPAPYSSPSKPITVGLRHLDPGSPAPRFEAECLRTTHSVVIGVRAENGVDLPIVRLGQVIGKTDQNGQAHLLLETNPNETITLKLDTSGNYLLRPESPNLTFVSKDIDEFVLLEQKFLVKKKYVKPVAKPPRPLPL
jgi:hypothetical protein